MIERCRNLLVAVLAVVTLSPEPVRADFVDDLADFWTRSSRGVNVTRPSHYEGSRAGYVSLGSLYVRTPSRNTNLGNIQLPSVRAGCGGIDVFGGAFSFLSASELIAMMEAIMANASGFAFELALESLSPAVQEVVGKLRDLSQAVNATNINSCETGQLLVSSLWPKMDAASQHICQTISTTSGIVADRAKARHGCGTGGDHSSTVQGATGSLKDQTPVDVNYAWRASSKNAFLVSDQELREFFMTITGTIIVTGSANDNDPRGHVSHAPKAFTPQVIRTLVDGGDIDILRCDRDPEDRCLAPTLETTAIGEGDALFARVADLIWQLNEALANDEPTVNETIALMGMTTIPIYDTIKTARAYKYEFAREEVNLMAELVAIDVAMVYTRDVIEEMQRAAANTEGLGDQLGEYRGQVERSFSNFTAMRREAAERYGDALATLNRLMTIKSALAGETSGWLATQIAKF